MARSAMVSLLALAACGRIGFDTVVDADPTPPGLVVAFPLETCGPTVPDAISGHPGTCTPPGCPVPTPGRHGGACLPAPHPAATIALGAWQHLAATWDGSTKRVYVDGTLRASSSEPAALAFDQNAAVIGCDNQVSGTTNEFFAGALDDVQLFDRALGDAEIAALAAR